ncbi:RICIN domain-containing protein [Saccharothrix variisporea]|uniref:RICIN domain-containing protein n=1 Tax=Saccharothrix variisporea TaxID=543527 RepID=UPI001FE99DC3|nr:ricin-type beta-trefoil lectin domain protein [Saccharothrix variisporea]
MQLKDGSYAVTISGTSPGKVFTSPSLDGPWTARGDVVVASGPYSSSFRTQDNLRIILRPDGKYEAITSNFQLATADNVTGPYTVLTPRLFDQIAGSPNQDMADPLLFYTGHTYHVIFNNWRAKKAYHYTSSDGVTNWTLQPGIAYDPTAGFIRYTDGTVNNWTKLERPGVYIENGHAVAMTFAAIDVEKENDLGNGQHGSKVIVVPFDGAGLDDTSPGPQGSMIVGGQSGRCVDVPGASTTNGTQVQLWDCGGQPNQRWTATSGKQLQVYGNKCLDASGRGTTNGTQVVIWDCNGQSNQQWNINTNGTITGVQSGLCLDATANGTANGTKLILWTCNGGQNQRWTLRS